MRDARSWTSATVPFRPRRVSASRDSARAKVSHTSRRARARRRVLSTSAHADRFIARVSDLRTVAHPSRITARASAPARPSPSNPRRHARPKRPRRQGSRPHRRWTRARVRVKITRDESVRGRARDAHRQGFTHAVQRHAPGTRRGTLLVGGDARRSRAHLSKRELSNHTRRGGRDRSRE